MAAQQPACWAAIRRRAVFFAVGSSCGADAYAGYVSPSSCRAWKAGDSGHMGVPNLADGSSGECEIDASSIGSGYEADSAYSIVVKSNSGSKQYKLRSSDGQCLGDDTSAYGMSESKTFSWVAPSSESSVTFHALCGGGYTSLLAAAPVEKNAITLSPSTAAASTSPPSTPVPSPTSSPASPTPAPLPTPSSTPAPEQTLPATSAATTLAVTSPEPPTDLPSEEPQAVAKVAKKSGISLGDTGMTLSYEPIGEDSIQIEVTVKEPSWISIGFANGDTTSMVGSGGGADVVTCSDSGVERFFVTSYALSGGESLPGATCTQESGRTTLKFQRSLAAEGRRLSQTEVAIRPGSPQQLIFARGSRGIFTLSQHPAGRMRGGDRIDFASGDITASAKRSGEAVLWLHLCLMSIAWGCLLPLGAIIAKGCKETLGGMWIKYHKGLQMAGWFLQIGGFVTSILYVEKYSVHFHGFHSLTGLFVVIIGTLHPLNAVFRPHLPKAGDEKSTPRKIWEWIHKGLGWVAVVLGCINIILGLGVLRIKEYDTITIVLAVVIAALALAIPLGALTFIFLPRTRTSASVASVAPEPASAWPESQHPSKIPS